MRVANFLASLIVASLIAACASEPPAPPPPGGPDKLRQAAVTDDTAYKVAKSLVDEVGPRFAGTPNDPRAVQWAVAKLKELGFQNVHTEPVTVPAWDRGQAGVELQSNKHLLDSVALGGSVPSNSRGVEADVVLVPSLEELAKLPDAAVQGKVVYFSQRMQRTRDGTGYQKAVLVRRNGPAEAARKGARAVLIRSVGTDANGVPHTGKTFYLDNVTKIPAVALSWPAADELEAELAKGQPVKVRVALTSGTRPNAQSANVVGEIPGETAELVLLGAHLDSWDITPGANDDAAGVGLVIAAAHRVAQMGKPHRTLRVVLFANEEYGVDGGKAYAAAHAAEAPRIALLMEADSGSGPAWRLNGAVAAADWPRVTALATDLQLQLGANNQEGGTDVGELRKYFVPEIEVGQDATHYFDVHHTVNDTTDKLDKAGLLQASHVLSVVLHAAASGPMFGRAAPPPAAK